MVRRAAVVLVGLALVALAVVVRGGGDDGGLGPLATSSPDPTTSPAASAAVPATLVVGTGPDAWPLGTRALPLRADGYGQVLATPPALRDRRYTAPDTLAPPASGRFESAIAPLTPDLVARTTWRPGCPEPPERLRWLTMSFWGFDDRPHTGEMVVREDVAADVVTVFSRLFAARFPIEQMRVVSSADLDARPTGDGNNTSAYACRTATGQTRFSAHASGIAIDVDPFQNPLQRRDWLVIPELASAYARPGPPRPGMIEPGDVVVRAFDGVGWTWGATFTAPKDTMHFSADGQ